MKIDIPNDKEYEKFLQVKHKVAEIMKILDIGVHAGNYETPDRIAKMYCLEVFKNRHGDTKELDSSMTTFSDPNDGECPVSVKGIKFVSFCEHHWLPFMGYVDITYVPKYRILGLSKFPRIVEWFSKKPQLQERLTKEIGDYLVELLQPKELKIVIRDVRHTCVEARGVEAECSTDTVYNYKEVG